MREILFRGKVISADNDLDGKWIFGQLVVRPDHDDGIDKTFICESGHRFIRCLSKMPCTYEVDPNTVGQYTGLKTEGKRIFEGDIVAGDNYWHENRKKYQVAFYEGCFFLVDDGGRFWHKDHIENVEVIDNIHDNPELCAEVEG